MAFSFATPGQERPFIHVLVSCLFYGASFCFVETILALRLTFAFYLRRLFEKKSKTTKKYKQHSRLSNFSDSG